MKTKVYASLPITGHDLEETKKVTIYQFTEIFNVVDFK